MSEDLDRFEAMVANSATRKNSLWVTVGCGVGTVYAFSLGGTGGPLVGAFMLVVTSWYLWVALRPLRFDPFLRVLRRRPLDVVATFVYEVHRLGAHANTFVALKLKSGAVVETAVPQGQGEMWREQLAPRLPNAAHYNRAP